MVVSHVAHAAPPPDADMSFAPWFHSLTIPNTGSSCCGAADCRHYPVVVASDGYHVQFRGQWLEVPPSAVQAQVQDTCKKWSQGHLERKRLGIEGAWQLVHVEDVLAKATEPASA